MHNAGQAMSCSVWLDPNVHPLDFRDDSSDWPPNQEPSLCLVNRLNNGIMGLPVAANNHAIAFNTEK